MTRLVIKGAYYYDNESDNILIPHYTGEFCIVDCDRYIRMKELKGNYDQSYIQEVKDNPIIFKGKEYYNAEWGPVDVSDEWDLLSDLSNLAHLEENFDWN